MLISCEKFFGAYTGTLPQIAQNIQCATSNHAMRQIWRNAPRLATPAVDHNLKWHHNARHYAARAAACSKIIHYHFDR